MMSRTLLRWSLVASTMLMLAGCGASGMPAPGALQPMKRADGTLVETLDRKPPEYEKVFPVPYKPVSHPVKVIAHRGYSKVAPENTLSAIEAAIAAGADAIEIDIHLTEDDQLAVIHDWDLKRTTDGRGDVEEMTMEELKRFDAGSWFSPAFAGERIPTLDEALALMKGHVTPVIEVKTRSTRVSKPLYETLVRHGMLENALVTSFFAKPLARYRDSAPKLPFAILVPPLVSATNRALDLRAGTTQGYYKSIGKKNIDLAHSLGLQVHAWTVNDEATMQGLVSLGIDGLITDEVTLAREVIDRHFAPQPQPQPQPPASEPVPVEPAPIPALARR